MNTTAQWLSWWQRGVQGGSDNLFLRAMTLGFLASKTDPYQRPTGGLARARDVAVRVPLWARCVILHHAQSLVLLLSRCSNKTPQLFLQYYNYDAINTCLIKIPRNKTDEGCECLGTWAISTGLPSSSTSFPLTSGLSFTEDCWTGNE